MTVMAPERAAYSRMVYEHIIANPDLHNQDGFGHKEDCGTVCCIAGWACVLDPDTEVQWDSYETMQLDVYVEGVKFELDIRAEELLGISGRAAYDLFYDYDKESALNKLNAWIEEAEAAA